MRRSLSVAAHDQHPLADTTHRRQIVAHEQVRHSERVAPFGEQVEDDRLHADVQRRRRFVEYEQTGTQCDRARCANDGRP